MYCLDDVNVCFFWKCEGSKKVLSLEKIDNRVNVLLVVDVFLNMGEFWFFFLFMIEIGIV